MKSTSKQDKDTQHKNTTKETKTMRKQTKKQNNVINYFIIYFTLCQDSLLCTVTDLLTKSMPQTVDNCKQSHHALRYAFPFLVNISIKDGKY